jgi:hypothetical protein
MSALNCAVTNEVVGTGYAAEASRLSNARRDQNPRIEWPEIPAGTPNLAPYRKRVVCKGWVVETVGHKLMTHHPVIEPVSVPTAGTEFQHAETDS